MTTANESRRRGFIRTLMFCSLLLAVHNSAWAVSGVWTETTGDGPWSTGGNWSGGTIADGSGSTADFSQINLDAQAVFNLFGNDAVGNPLARNAVQLSTPRTIGNITFGDSNLASPGGWEIYSLDYPTNLLTLAGTTPTITVNALTPINTSALVGAAPTTPELIDDAIIRTSLVGTSGFAKAGAGILTLSGPANTITGPININAGTLRTNSALPAGATINIGNGATLSTNTTLNGLGNRVFNVAPGTTANLEIRGNVELGRVVADNATLNVSITSTGSTFTPSGNWNLTGSPTAVNVTSTAGGFFRIAPNNNDPLRNFNTNTFVGTVLSLDNVTVPVRTNSTGNDINIGALTGTATAALDGGGNTGGVSTARYHIGQLNTSTTFAGGIQNTSTGSILIDKVGTGTLTLSGNLTYSTTANTLADQRGGVTRITAGTLKLTGSAAIPGGIADAGLGDLYTSIDVRVGATLDVATTTAPYSTAALQQIVGPGTITGNFIHGAGRIRAADVLQGNSNTPTPTAGTITFANNLSFVGSGEIVYDMGLNPAAGNDRIQVNGSTNLTSSTTKVTPNFLTGTVPSTGTYTILNSLGGFTGTPSGWTVVWPGRGAGPTVVTNGTLLQFDAVPVIGGANLNWTGTSSSNWDVNATQNWRNNGTNANDKYFNDDNVTFADTHSGGTAVTNFSVNLGANVSPRSVTIDSTNTYTFTGPGVITGTSTFTKRGSSSLVMQRANTFSGAAAIEGSTVDIGNFNGALGTGMLTLSNATVLAANTATAGMTNSGLTLAPGTSNTIRADGDQPDTFDIPAASGSGNLQITTTVNNKLIGIGNMSAFTGNLSAGGDGVTATAMTVRVSPASSMPNSVVTLSNGGSLANRTGSSTPGVVSLGALVGDATTVLDGFTGGGTAPSTVWQIGNLNTSTEFAGTIIDGSGGPSGTPVLIPSAVTKVGTGTLTLSGANVYTGNTTVTAGTLSINSPFLANLADVSIASGAFLNLNFADTDTIDALTLNGAPAAIGTWGSMLSSATHKTDRITGSGLLMVSTTTAPPGFTGDYNNDGRVDAADYTVWRDNFGGPGTALQHRDPNNGTGPASQADYVSWKNNFGTGLGAGSLADQQSVPEPSTLVLAVLILLPLAGGYSSRRR